MPNVKRWADDLRAAFGVAEVDAGLRSQGYYAREGGRSIDTRKYAQGMLVVPVLPLLKAEGKRGR